MIKINGEELKVGDIAIFRCGGKARVRKIENDFGFHNIYFNHEKNSSPYKIYGQYDGNYEPTGNIWDIVDITKDTESKGRE